jgi:hypothetical protein
MSDIQKGPIQPGQATMPQKDNTGLKVVAIVLGVVFGLPLLFAIVVLIFISANFDKFTAWIDSHIDDWSYYEDISRADVADSARQIYSAAGNENVTVWRDDCYNVSAVLRGSNNASRMMSDICNDDEIKIAAGDIARKDDDDKRSIYFEKDELCLEFIFEDDFWHYESYNYTSKNGCGREMTTVKLEDDVDIYDEDGGDLEEVEDTIQRS